MYAAQAIPQIDAEIAKKGNFWMETKRKILLALGYKISDKNKVFFD